MCNEQFRELVAGHALSALEPEDEYVLLAHLRACAPCSRELLVQRQALAQLAYAVEPVEPPASLLAGIRVRMLESDPDAFGIPELTPHAVTSRTASPTGTTLPLRRPPRRLQTRAARLVAVAACASIAAIVGLGAWNIALRQDNVEQAQVSAQFQAALDTIKGGPGQTVTLRSPEGDVKVVAVLHGDKMDLVTDGFQPNGEQDRYVVWGKTGTNNPEPLGDFAIDSDGIDVVRGVWTLGQPLPEVLLVSRESGSLTTRLPVAPRQPIYAQGETSA